LPRRRYQIQTRVPPRTVDQWLRDYTFPFGVGLLRLNVLSRMCTIVAFHMIANNANYQLNSCIHVWNRGQCGNGYSFMFEH
ncbi:hypothetical protein T10_9038, partial [Trichinella papuae]